MNDIYMEQQYNLSKLQMLQALARSQCAVASILEQTAIVAAEYSLPHRLIQEQLRSLANYQSTLISQLSGIRVRNIQHGVPDHPPWINNKLISHRTGING